MVDDPAINPRNPIYPVEAMCPNDSKASIPFAGPRENDAIPLDDPSCRFLKAIIKRRD